MSGFLGVCASLFQRRRAYFKMANRLGTIGWLWAIQTAVSGQGGREFHIVSILGSQSRTRSHL